MKSVRIKNLKSIEDSGYVDIKPMTILIGKNSCGKSSFARVFPLMKQSVDTNLSSPVLWYGKDVDFGSFKNSLSSWKEGELIYFSFSFSAPHQKSGGEKMQKKSKSLIVLGRDPSLSIALL